MELLEIVSSEPEIKHLNCFQVVGFMGTCREMLPSIRQGWREQGTNENLPTNVVAFIADHLRMRFSDVTKCWKLLSSTIMKENYDDFDHIIAHAYENAENVQKLWSFQLGEGSENLDLIERCNSQIINSRSNP